MNYNEYVYIIYYISLNDIYTFIFTEYKFIIYFNCIRYVRSPPALQTPAPADNILKPF